MHQVTYVPRKTNHLLHLILTFATCGAWLFVWPLVVLYNHMTKDKVRTQQMWSGPGAYTPGLAPAQTPVDTSTWPEGQTGYQPRSYGVLRPDGVATWRDPVNPPLQPPLNAPPSPPQEPHVHRASCHGAIGELLCGFPG